MIATPSDFSRRRKVNSFSTSPPDSAVVGSSRIRISHIARNRLDDFRQLALARRQIADQRQRIDVDAERREQCARALRGACIVDEAERALHFVVEENVLRDGQRRHEAHFLKDHADAGALGGVGRVFGQRRAVDLDRPGASAHARR